MGKHALSRRAELFVLCWVRGGEREGVRRWALLSWRLPARWLLWGWETREGQEQEGHWLSHWRDREP